MSLTNGYCTLAEVKDRLKIDDTQDDTRLESVIEAVSRWLDEDRKRRPLVASGSNETRYFTPRSSGYVVIDDLLSLTTLKTDEDADGTYETTWAATDYYLAPYNASLEGHPYTFIERSPFAAYYFPERPRAVQVVGSFGYSADIPRPIREACILLSMRVFKRKDLVFGTAGNADLGTVEAIVSAKKDGELITLLEAVPRRMVK